MTEVSRFIESQLAASYAKEPTDYEDLYTMQFSDRENGTVMPPSPGVVGYNLNYQYTGLSVVYDLQVKWHDSIKWLLDQVEPWQVTHRSRTAVIAASPLRVAENQKRIANITEWKSTYEDFSLSDSQSDQLFQLVLDRTKEYMEFSPDWIKHYIKEHLGSSLGGGFKWKDTLSMSLGEWKSIYDSTIENIEILKEHSGDFLNIVYNHGLRARSPDMPAFNDNFSGEIERTRIVMFHQYLSLWNVFIPHKKQWYERILKDVEDMFAVEPEIYYPYVEGGEIYLRASELLSDGFKLHAYDGKSWESSVGLILGKAFRPMMVYMRGFYMLPSGIAATSLLGTIASVIVNKKANGYMITLGDDQNHFVKGKLKGIPRVPWVDEQPMDSKTGTILGASFWKPEAPRLTGFKVMSDRADKALPMLLTRDVNNIQSQPKRDPRERAAWLGMFLGFYGDGTLISRLRKEKIEEQDFFAPRLTIQSLVDDESQDVYAWAEREGVKDLVIAK
jgi:hypothetical protein